MKSIIHVDPEILGGTPVFSGTRVPLKNLFDYLEEGESISAFLDDFPTVTMAQVKGILEMSQQLLMNFSKVSHANSAG
jgi:uncharacterized protein (DUF433 family)